MGKFVKGDFATGSLRRNSNVRPNRLFTADSNIILYKAGVLTPDKVNEIITKIVQIVRS
jgi:mRNA interferase MazF